MSETIISIPVKICSQCPHFKITNRSTTDGFGLGEVESVECMKEGESGVSFEYRVWMYRTLIADNFGLIEFLK